MKLENIPIILSNLFSVDVRENPCGLFLDIPLLWASGGQCGRCLCAGQSLGWPALRQAEGQGTWETLASSSSWHRWKNQRSPQQPLTVSWIIDPKSIISAIYTCIKKPESFSHSGFSLKVARQLPLNTKKKRIEKPTSAVRFFETPPKFHWFFANVNARSNLAGIIQVFGHVVRDLQRNHPTAARDVMRTTRVRSKVEKSRSAPLTKTQVWDSGFFAHALFVPKTPNAMGFSGSVNGTTKNPGFLDFGFCQCKWAYNCSFCCKILHHRKSYLSVFCLLRFDIHDTGSKVTTTCIFNLNKQILEHQSMGGQVYMCWRLM